MYNDLFDCNTCNTRQCEEAGEWKHVVWELSPAADWENGKICPKPTVLRDSAVIYWYELYISWRDRKLPPNAGGYADQSAKLMAIMGIMSAWQSDHDAEVRERDQARARHHSIKK